MSYVESLLCCISVREITHCLEIMNLGSGFIPGTATCLHFSVDLFPQWVRPCISGHAPGLLGVAGPEVGVSCCRGVTIAVRLN